MAKKRETAPIYLKRTSRGYEPASPVDADMLADLIPIGGEVEITVRRRKRSLPQLRLYWKALHRVVDADLLPGIPSAEHLHEIIKYDLGYCTKMQRLDGGIYFIPDSAALDGMDADQFNAFFERAQRLMAQHGIDLLAFYDERAAA